MEKRALVVDNDFFFVEFLTELMQDRGYTVIKAYDGKDGMDKLNEHRIDIMFADIVMPKVDGWQLINYIRKKFPARPFPIVAVSGTIIEQLDDLKKIDADYYIAKGPMEKMKDQFNSFVDAIESHPFPSQEEITVFDVGNLFPRREAVELIESLQFQRAIVESLGLGVLVADRDAIIITATEKACSLFGRNSSDVLNQKIPELFPPMEKPKLISNMKQIARNPDLKRLTFRAAIRGNQMRFIVSLLAFEGKNIGWVVAIEEINPKKDGA